MNRMKPLLISLWVVPLLACAACRSPYYADQGAALGGIAGGLTGAALGDRQDNALGGALIGTAVGALTGAAIGDSMDAELDRRQALIEAKTGRRMAGAVTTSDVVTMVKSGLSDDVVINHVRANGVASLLTPNDIIHMHDSGVSEKVINAMQQTAASQVAAPPIAYGTPVIIQEPYVVPHYWRPAPYWCGPGPYRHHYRPPGVTWGFSYSH
jgi:surface antigen